MDEGIYDLIGIVNLVDRLHKEIETQRAKKEQYDIAQQLAKDRAYKKEQYIVKLLETIQARGKILDDAIVKARGYNHTEEFTGKLMAVFNAKEELFTAINDIPLPN